MNRMTLPLFVVLPFCPWVEEVNAQSTWVDFSNRSGSWISGDPALTTSDLEEKDLWASDLDKDGDPDVIIVRKTPFSTPGQQVNVLLMNQSGVLTERNDLIPGFWIPDDSRDVITVDVDRDGWEDIVVCNTFGDDPRLFLNQGVDAGGVFLGFLEDPGWFSPPFAVGPKFCAVAAGDVNQDGFPDLFFSDYDNTLEDALLINDGSGRFVNETTSILMT